ncbi:hypothetical protein M4578_01945 [Salipiger sp. P9]|uniref:DUF7742 family protein n=1 Tax=Salipiger pentaromativorans TaxID=2943193 RepID=UPI002157BAC6|nr:hypothetical protein [Salipiger pentaromativorans]MCR8546575.1 hypothetical protein [Salipiger pentaromativorans]
MRPVLHGDLICAACALLAVPRGQRWRFARDLVARADAADRYRRHLGRAHPDWGNGTLMAAALAHVLAPERRLDDPDYAECLILVLEALRVWRAGRGRLPDTARGGGEGPRG